jgi:hypothetical protein
MLKKEIGLEMIRQQSARITGYIPYLERKCGNNCKLGITMNAGKVMRLKTPKTMINERMPQERMDERFLESD